ncbi:LPS-assembly protein LptD [Deinococcus cellulosilyticus]|uniref:LPS-assembly protein LptD n=1 Tax=Deinococcus cellulosilyticus (strain DSM 18568 / NBRC 106333 / KACC 11606 / 5516J-15) TaxID=1223518 RepID=A0A511NBP1_DEIC1|nr:LPS-assembly protein LptD [Deinococcus cellulosilyticus]GEM49918.1 hypothetical protein DC3_55530 [Deinococcus cellulosilyticus NBRC 106333 = KACC 11606]
MVGLRFFIVLIFVVFSWAQGRTIEIVQAGQLELRNVTLDDGTVQEYIILIGEPVELKIDDSVIKADRVEYNKSARELRLIGRAKYITKTKGSDGNSTSEQTLEGDDLKVDLSIEGVEGEDVFITTQNILVKGDVVQRIPGQIGVQGGYFTPCARCGRTPNDYAFSASTMWIYPGNRIVAYDVKVLIADTPVFYLPALVFMLNKERPTKLEVGQSPTDGWTVSADLPYLITADSFGTLFVDYYQNRDVPIGVKVDHTLYNLFGQNNTSKLQVWMDPKGVGRQGVDWVFNVDVKGNQPALAAKSGLDYSFSISRNDKQEFNVLPIQAEVKGEWEGFSARIGYYNVIDGDGNNQVARFSEPRKLPEIEFDPKAIKVFRVNYDPKLLLGYYEGESNPLNPSARRAGDRIAAFRAQYSHSLSWAWKPWSTADLNLTQTFNGQYFSTDERAVQQTFTANFTNTFSTGNSISLTYLFEYLEGETPFTFDRVPKRKTHTLGVSANAQPAPELSLSAQQTIDFEKKADEQQNGTVSLNYNPKPVSISVTYSENVFLHRPQSISGTFRVTQDTLSMAVGASYDYGNPDPNPIRYRSPRFGDLTVDFSYTSPDKGHTASLNYIYDINVPRAKSITGNYAFTGPIEALDDIFGVTTWDNYGPAMYSAKLMEKYDYTTSVWNGSLDLSRERVKLTATHNLYVGEDTGRQWKGNLDATLGIDNFSLTFNGPLDLNRRGFFTKPTLTAKYSQAITGAELSASATLALKGLDYQHTDLSTAYLSGQWWIADFLGIQGNVTYNGSWDQTDTVRRDELRLNPLTLTATIGREGNEPQWILAASVLDQTYTWINGDYQGPQFQPNLKLIYNRCCWSGLVEWSPNRGTFRFALNLMQSSYFDLIKGTPEGIRGPF